MEIKQIVFIDSFLSHPVYWQCFFLILCNRDEMNLNEMHRDEMAAMKCPRIFRISCCLGQSITIWWLLYRWVLLPFCYPDLLFLSLSLVYWARRRRSSVRWFQKAGNIYAAIQLVLAQSSSYNFVQKSVSLRQRSIPSRPFIVATSFTVFSVLLKLYRLKCAISWIQP